MTNAHRMVYPGSKAHSLIRWTIRGSKISLLLCAETAETQPQYHTLPSASHHIMIPSLPLSPLYDLAYGVKSMFCISHVLSKPFTRTHVLLSATSLCLPACLPVYLPSSRLSTEHKATFRPTWIWMEPVRWCSKGCNAGAFNKTKCWTRFNHCCNAMWHPQQNAALATQINASKHSYWITL